MNTNELIQAESRYLVQTYKRPEMVLDRGDGVYLYDTDGRRYLDFASGIAVTALGHSDPEWAAAVADQASRLTHVSNLYHTRGQIELARRLVEQSFADRVFFCNTGAEANEGALKFARKAARDRGYEDKTSIVAFRGSFHGRTMGALSVTYKAHYREPFNPLVPGVHFAHYNDLHDAAAIIDETTCAVIVEPLQGEGGVRPADPGFLRGLRDRCDATGALLIFDEVQCGLGRSGRLWAYEHSGVKPDIMTLAKPLAGGLPIGAILVTEAVASVLHPGDHGSTFAGGPLVTRAAQVVFDRIAQPDFLRQVEENGEYLRRRLEDLPTTHVKEVRGMGLLVGVELDTAVASVIASARERGLLVINAGDDVLRIAPPLVINRAEIDEGIAALAGALAEL